MSAGAHHSGFFPRRRGIRMTGKVYFLCFLRQSAVALGVGGCLLWPFLPACSKRNQVATPAEKILRISQRNEPATLDPQLATLPDEFFIIRALGEGLLTPNPDGGAPLPGLAEKWEVSPDGLTYVFHLRPNASWSGGQPVVALDFVRTIERAINPATAAPKAALFFAIRGAAERYQGGFDIPIRLGVTATDAHTLRFELAHPFADFPAIVASGPWIPSPPKPGLSNGPFILEEWKPNQHIAVRKNPHYWAAANVKLDGIHFLAFDNGDTEERAFRAGQLDVTMAVPFSKLVPYRAEQPALIHSVPLNETRYLALNVTRPPLNDPRVRRALALALDRTALVEKVILSGRPAFNFVPAGLGGYEPTEGLHEDAAEARRLLAEAGFPEGHGFPKLELATWPVSSAQLEAIQQMWRRELGIEVAIAQREAHTHLASLASGDFAIAFMTAIPDYDGASDLFTPLTGGHPLNYPHWHDEEFDRLVASAGRLADLAARTAAYQQAEARLLAEMPVIPLYFNAQNFLLAPRVKNWRVDRLWTRFYRELSVE
jgi:oligopeptide transport system substrate-binding protein